MNEEVNNQKTTSQRYKDTKRKEDIVAVSEATSEATPEGPLRRP